MEIRTPKQFIEEVLPSRFRPDRAANFEVDAQLILTGPMGGNWIITLKNQSLKIAEGIHPFPMLTLKMTDTDFMDLINGKSSTTKAFFTGRIQLTGDFNLALKLRDAGLLDFGT